jgi:hypothetical protein
MFLLASGVATFREGTDKVVAAAMFELEVGDRCWPDVELGGGRVRPDSLSS